MADLETDYYFFRKFFLKQIKGIDAQKPILDISPKALKPTQIRSKFDILKVWSFLSKSVLDLVFTDSWFQLKNPS